MRKVLLSIFIFLVVAVAIGLFILRHNSARYLSEYLSATLNVPVHVENIKLSFNRISIIDLTIKNPQSEKHVIQNAFQCPRIDIDYTLTSLFKEVVHIRELYLENPTIGIELYNTTGTDNNWVDLINNIDKSEAAQATSPNPKAKKQHTVEIEKLLIEPLHILYYSEKNGGHPTNLTPINKIELHNIGSNKHSISYDQALNVIAQAIIMEVIKQRGLTNILQGAVRLPEDILKSIVPGNSDSIFNKAWNGIEDLFKRGN